MRYDTNQCLVAILDGQLFVIRVTRRVLLMEQELLAHPNHPRWPPGFSGVHVARSLVFMCCFVDRWLSFFSLPLYYLFFFDLRVLVIPLVSSNLSYVLSFVTRSCIPSFCCIIINAPTLLFPVQPFTSIFYYLSVCSRCDYSYITTHVR